MYVTAGGDDFRRISLREHPHSLSFKIQLSLTEKERNSPEFRHWLPGLNEMERPSVRPSVCLYLPDHSIIFESLREIPTVTKLGAPRVARLFRRWPY